MTLLSSSSALCIGISSCRSFPSVLHINGMEDAIGTTDEALAPSLTPTAPEGSGLHDFVISGTVLQRAVLPEDSYELKMILTKSLTSATPMPLISSCSFI
ncbi:uncharacterized protein LOC131146190 isoform X2 [Malania oleifera]|uniref:uncharacterized protein LOC131146190 isoform X2 n=1 Tax=Malania oleifera TaxID=397392 RepID=UPI0025AE66BA|nr:uncharacterized protein LOC131146190 isoform X2 [Malania oleifera]